MSYLAVYDIYFTNRLFMEPYKSTPAPYFIGREAEIRRFREIHQRDEAVIIVVYGRRRVGKTELIEHFFKSAKILKFEGIQPNFKDRLSAQNDQSVQIRECLLRLSRYFEDPKLAKLKLHSWSEFFELLGPVMKKRKIILYFEEIQWLSSYASRFLACLKPFWDDSWRHNKKLRIILCGSSPSFIMGQVLADKALYGRSLEQFHLKPFNLLEIREFLGGNKIGPRETMLAQLCVGGIPEYLKKIKGSDGVYVNICKNSFLRDSFFSTEKEKIFIGSLSHSKNYEAIVTLLSKSKQASRPDIAKNLGVEAGGTLTTLLVDLETCGFICKYTPLYLNEQSKLVRFCIADNFLQFYDTFIQPNKRNIEKDKFVKDATKAISTHRLNIILGFAFERWCRQNDHILARIMKFNQIEYVSGSFYNYKTVEKDKNFQIDLMYIRADLKIVVCEIKYLVDQVPAEVEQKLAQKITFFKESLPKYKNHSFQTALITTQGIKQVGLFDHVITFAELFDQKNWEE